jgi:hypothetical protein
MNPRFRKFVLLLHIATSAGWFGAIIPYIVLTIAGFVSQNAQTVRAAYSGMEIIGWFAIVPLSLAALLSGLVQSLGTQWGLLRQWWIVSKLGLTIVSVTILIRHMQDMSRMAQMVAVPRGELVHSIGGLLVVFAAMMLSIYKPWGLTPYGRKGEVIDQPAETPHQRKRVFATRPLRWRRVVLYHALAIVLLLAVAHISGIHH